MHAHLNGIFGTARCGHQLVRTGMTLGPNYVNNGGSWSTVALTLDRFGVLVSGELHVFDEFLHGCHLLDTVVSGHAKPCCCHCILHARGEQGSSS